MNTATTHKGRKILKNREPKFVENRKQSLFVKGLKCSQELNYFWDELAKFRHGELAKYAKKNDIFPFESVDLLEKYCNKKQCSLFTFFSHTKKRPMNVIFGRLFNAHVLEMYEFGVFDFIRYPNLPNADVDNGAVPALVFQGEQWDTDFAQVRSVFIDFFVGDLKGSVNLEQVQHALVFTITDSETPVICVRHYSVKCDRGNNVSLSLVAPSFNLVPRRKMDPDAEVLEQSLIKPVVGKKVKNVTTDALGRKVGRVFVRKQDTKEIKPAKFRGLRKIKKQKQGNSIDDAL
ncbi:Ribosome production factor 2 [Histomonas meleagridis]|uniref:Ribosome production factor 2-like n=1 Tax=Histomonas meleagridis TaxID=135588 RepID=UPI003559AC70|nr:Ribosome production factor 2 [Histomonas meleagridis]KAH0801213.1 Ribosome production factor 2-like [Histomonas meleagridis]